MTVPLVVLAVLFSALVVWAITSGPKANRELLQAEALDRLSEGFDWAYEEPYIAFHLQDGSRVLYEFHHAGRWWEPSD